MTRALASTGSADRPGFLITSSDGTGYYQQFLSTIDSSGNIYTVGVTERTLGQYATVTAKYTSNGLLTWSREYVTPAGASGYYPYPVGLNIDSTGAVLIALQDSNALLNQAAIIIKYTSAGVISVVSSFSLPAPFLGTSMLPLSMSLTSGNNVVLCGQATHGTSGLNYGWVMYIPSALTSVTFTRTFTGGTDDYAVACGSDSSSNIYIINNTINGGVYKANLIKLTSAGATTLQRFYTQGNGYNALNGFFDSSGNAYISLYAAGGSLFRPQIVKYLAAGTLSYQLDYIDAGNYGWDGNFMFIQSDSAGAPILFYSTTIPGSNYVSKTTGILRTSTAGAVNSFAILGQTIQTNQYNYPLGGADASNIYYSQNNVFNTGGSPSFYLTNYVAKIPTGTITNQISSSGYEIGTFTPNTGVQLLDPSAYTVTSATNTGTDAAGTTTIASITTARAAIAGTDYLGFDISQIRRTNI